MFDYLDYKNKIPLEKCLIEIPRINPMSVNYERFWYHTIKRKQIEGSWVEHEGDFQWLPGTIFQYVNMWNIEMKKKTGTSKGKVIGRPRLRDLEWIKGYVHATARGFSGFINDTEISCHRILINPEMDELLEYMDDSVKATIYKPDGSLKEYKDALQYLYQYKKSNLGKPLFHNTAKNVLEIGARNYGKDLEENTLLLYKDGSYPIKDVKVGDEIYDDNGNLVKVTHKFDFKDQEQYEITFQDGRKIICGGGHKWDVYYNSKYRTVDLNFILSKKWKTTRKNGYPEYLFRIPTTKSVNYSEKEFKIDPYILGAWLGDGHSRSFSITNVDEEILNAFKEYAISNSYNIRQDGISYFMTGTRLDNPTKVIRDMNLRMNKHIPEEYFYGSKEQRLSLLQGLMDTDGTIGFKGYADFSNKNYRLIQDVQRLCWSLGIRAMIRPKISTCTYKGIKNTFNSYRVFINTDLPIFKLTRKLNKIELNTSTKSKKSASSNAIIDIKPLGIKPSVCISVENKSHLFLANDYIVTHNSVSSGNFCGHNFLTDGAMDYDEWWANKQLPKDRQEVYTTQTLIGASDSKYVNNLNKHLKIGLENLPGKMEVGKVLYPPPLSKKTSGSWVVGKDIIARYEEKIGGKWEVKGSGSGFLNRSFKDNPYAANGSRYGFGLIDEVGFMDNFEDVLGQLHECTTVDGEKYGTIWATGTGGSMENGATEPAKRVFYDPEAQEFLAFDDIFENKGKIGLFIPAWMALDEYRDKLGNINRELALKKLSKERELARNAKSKKPLYDLLQMKPLVPSEAFLVLEGNIFPTAELKEHLATLETTERLKELGTNGWMQRDGEGKAYFKVDHRLHQTDFPTEYSIDDKGAVVIWEQPSADTPYGLYIAGIDSIDQDQAESSTSMGSIIIYKRLRNADETYHLPVAEYTGRPEFATDFYEQCRRLLEYYNAKALYENQTPGIKAYFETKNCLHLLARQPSIIKSISPNTKVDRIYGTHMTKPIKDAIEIMTRDWLKAELEPGVLQLTKIKCIPLLKELIAYNKDGNFDRVIAFMLVMMQDLELHKIIIEEKKEIIQEDNFFSRKLFV